MLKLLLSHSPDASSIPVLAHAIKGMDITIIRELVTCGANIKMVSDTAVGMLSLALQQASPDLLGLLLVKGIGANTRIGADARILKFGCKEIEWMTPLTYACARPLPDHVLVLFRHGASVDAGEGVFHSPLYLIAMQRQSSSSYFGVKPYVKVAKMLIDKGGASPGIQEPTQGLTAIHLAVLHKDWELLNVLTRKVRGQELNKKAANGMMPLGMAQSQGWKEGENMLLDRKRTEDLMRRLDWERVYGP